MNIRWCRSETDWILSRSYMTMTPWHLNKFHDTMGTACDIVWHLTLTFAMYLHIMEDTNNVLIWAGQIAVNLICHQMLMNDYLEEDEENVGCCSVFQEVSGKCSFFDLKFRKIICLLNQKLSCLNNQATTASLWISETIINIIVTWWRACNIWFVYLNLEYWKNSWLMWWTLDSTLYNRAI